MTSYSQITVNIHSWAKSLLKVRGVERVPPFAAAALQNLGQFEDQQPKSIAHMEKLRGERRGFFTPSHRAGSR